MAARRYNKTNNGGDSISLRSLVSTRDAGVIIGRNGSHVQEIREQAGVSIRLSEYLPTQQERVLTVYGIVDGIGKVYFVVVTAGWQ